MSSLLVKNKSTEDYLKYLGEEGWQITIEYTEGKFSVHGFRYIEEPDAEDWGFTQSIYCSNSSLLNALQEVVTKAGNH